jgi:hypothetical protein
VSALLELAERCEQAAGPERELDNAIWAAAVANPPCPDHTKLGKLECSRFTASLDAAMTLVPEGKRLKVETAASGANAVIWQYGPTVVWDADARTPALALCAAALRARAASCDRNPTGQDREAGLGAEHESAVGAAETPKQDRP